MSRNKSIQETAQQSVAGLLFRCALNALPNVHSRGAARMLFWGAVVVVTGNARAQQAGVDEGAPGSDASTASVAHVTATLIVDTGDADALQSTNILYRLVSPGASVWSRALVRVADREIQDEVEREAAMARVELRQPQLTGNREIGVQVLSTDDRLRPRDVLDSFADEIVQDLRRLAEQLDERSTLLDVLEVQTAEAAEQIEVLRRRASQVRAQIADGKPFVISPEEFSRLESKKIDLEVQIEAIQARRNQIEHRLAELEAADRQPDAQRELLTTLQHIVELRQTALENAQHLSDQGVTGRSEIIRLETEYQMARAELAQLRLEFDRRLEHQRAPLRQEFAETELQLHTAHRQLEAIAARLAALRDQLRATERGDARRWEIEIEVLEDAYARLLTEQHAARIEMARRRPPQVAVLIVGEHPHINDNDGVQSDESDQAEAPAEE